MADKTEITYPLAKASAALGASAGASAMSLSQTAQAFLPVDLGGWLAAGASALAILYSLHLLGDFYWKKVWRPLAEAKGWLKPKRKVARIIYVDEEEETGPAAL